MKTENEVTEVTEKVALTNTGGAGGVLQWQKSFPLVVTRLVIEVTTQSTVPSKCDFGSATGPVSSDNLIDGGNTGAVRALDNIGDKGTNGKTCLRLVELQYITGSQSADSPGSVAGLQGFAYITYFPS